MAESDNSIVSINFDDVTRNEGLGNRGALLHTLLRGKNWLGGKPAVPVPEKSRALLFCTRPDFNMDELNIGKYRIFRPLVENGRYSMGSIIRSYLDPRACIEGRAYSDAIDPLYPFFPILDNTVVSLDGWNELVMDPYVSGEGKHDGAVYVMPTGQLRKGAPYTLSITHTPVAHDIVNETYRFIQEMMDHIKRDKVRDYNINVGLDIKSVMMRWYRIGFDITGNRVQSFTMCGEAYPIAGQIAAAAAYTDDHDTQIEPITATWQCAGLYHNDPGIIDEFNRTVCFSNPNMLDGAREHYYVRLGTPLDDNGAPVPSIVMASKFIGYGYPRINPRTLEFEIWVPKEIYDIVLLNKDISTVEEEVRNKAQRDFKEYVESTPDAAKYLR